MGPYVHDFVGVRAIGDGIEGGDEHHGFWSLSLVFNVPVSRKDLEALFLGGRSPRNYRCRYGLEEVGDNIGWAVEFGVYYPCLLDGCYVDLLVVRVILKVLTVLFMRRVAHLCGKLEWSLRLWGVEIVNRVYAFRH